MTVLNLVLAWQKQPSGGVLIKRYSENMQQIYRRTPMPKYDFNAKYCRSTITLRHGCSCVNMLYIFRMPFLNNTSLEGYFWSKDSKYKLKKKKKIEFLHNVCSECDLSKALNFRVILTSDSKFLFILSCNINACTALINFRIIILSTLD